MYRIVGICWLLFALLCIGAITVGHLHPIRPFISEIRDCGNSFCFLDVQTGTTTMNDARAILNNVPQLSRDVQDRDIWDQQTSKPYYRVWFGAPITTNVIETVSVSLSETELSAGDIVNRFGVPCKTFSLESGDITLVIYSKIIFVFQSREFFRLKPDDRLVMIRFDSTEMRKTICDTSIYLDYWKGFSSYY